MVNNGLKLNQDKTGLALEFIQVVDEKIRPKPPPRNPGVIIDQSLDLTDHVNKICVCCQYHLRNIDQEVLK